MSAGVNNLGSVLREARESGYNVAWPLDIWERKPPQPITDEFIARMENNSAKAATWELKDNTIVAIRKGDGHRLQVYRVI